MKNVGGGAPKKTGLFFPGKEEKGEKEKKLGGSGDTQRRRKSFRTHILRRTAAASISGLTIAEEEVVLSAKLPQHDLRV